MGYQGPRTPPSGEVPTTKGLGLYVQNVPDYPTHFIVPQNATLLAGAVARGSVTADGGRGRAVGSEGRVCDKGACRYLQPCAAETVKRLACNKPHSCYTPKNGIQRYEVRGLPVYRVWHLRARDTREKVHKHLAQPSAPAGYIECQRSRRRHFPTSWLRVHCTRERELLEC